MTEPEHRFEKIEILFREAKPGTNEINIASPAMVICAQSYEESQKAYSLVAQGSSYEIEALYKMLNYSETIDKAARVYEFCSADADDRKRALGIEALRKMLDLASTTDEAARVYEICSADADDRKRALGGEALRKMLDLASTTGEAARVYEICSADADDRKRALGGETLRKMLDLASTIDEVTRVNQYYLSQPKLHRLALKKIERIRIENELSTRNSIYDANSYHVAKDYFDKYQTDPEVSHMALCKMIMLARSREDSLHAYNLVVKDMNVLGTNNERKAAALKFVSRFSSFLDVKTFHKCLKRDSLLKTALEIRMVEIAGTFKEAYYASHFDHQKKQLKELRMKLIQYSRNDFERALTLYTMAQTAKTKALTENLMIDKIASYEQARIAYFAVDRILLMVPGTKSEGVSFMTAVYVKNMPSMRRIVSDKMRAYARSEMEIVETERLFRLVSEKKQQIIEKDLVCCKSDYGIWKVVNDDNI